MALHSAGSVTVETVKALVPAPAENTPLGVGVLSKPGESPRYALEDHTHAARIQRAALALDANGQGSWTFVKPFNMKPIVHYMVDKPTGDTGGPVTVECTGYTTALVDGASVWTAMQVQGYRATKQLPGLGNGLLTTVVSALANFVLQSNTGASGIVVNLSAGEPTPSL